MTAAATQPPPSKVIKYRVSINYPDMWKVRAIADYKMAQREKRKNTSIAEHSAADKLKKPVDDRSRSYLVPKKN
jgi:hypothetical protein